MDHERGRGNCQIGGACSSRSSLGTVEDGCAVGSMGFFWMGAMAVGIEMKRVRLMRARVSQEG